MLARDRNIRRGSAPSDRLIVLCFSNGSSFVASPPPSPPRPSCVIFIIDPANKEPFNPSPHLGVSTLIMGRRRRRRGETRASLLKTGTEWRSCLATDIQFEPRIGHVIFATARFLCKNMIGW